MLRWSFPHSLSGKRACSRDGSSGYCGELVGQDYVIGAALLRLGKYAVGVYHGEKLVSSKVGSRYVKGRHSAGGTSQLRYSRIRDKQIQEIFGKACEVAKAQLGPYEAALDFLFLGGGEPHAGRFPETLHLPGGDVIPNRRQDSQRA